MAKINEEQQNRKKSYMGYALNTSPDDDIYSFSSNIKIQR